MSRKSIIYLILLVSSITLVIFSGITFYNNLLETEKNKAYENLAAFAHLKINQIQNWREERISDGLFVKNNPLIGKHVFDFLRDPDNPSLKQQIVEWLKVLTDNNEYKDLVIIKRDLSAYSLFNDYYNINPRDSIYLQKALKENEVSLGGLNKDQKTSEIDLGIYIPLSMSGKNYVFSFLKIRINPYINLYPLIESVPTSSKTAETFIVRQEGDSVTFLNNLKFKENAAMNLKMPLSMNTIPAVMAVKGKVGIFVGFDYAGNEVLAYLNKVPDSPWFIISKMNLYEIYEPVRKQAIYITLGVLTLTILLILVAYTFWRNQVLKTLEEQLEFEKEKRISEQALRRSEERFATVFRNSPVAMAIADAQLYNTIDVNNSFELLFGYTREEVIGKTSSDLHLYDDIGMREKTIRQLNKFGEVKNLEINIVRKNGEKRTALVNIENIELDGKKCFLAVSQDITDRKKSDIKLASSEERFSTAFNSNPNALIISRLEDGKIIEVNDNFLEFFHLTRNEVIGSTTILLNIYSNPDDRNKIVSILMQKGLIRDLELTVRIKTGEERRVLLSAETLKTSQGQTFLTIFQDITERKRTESALIESEKRFRKMFEDHKAVMLIIDPGSGKIVDANPSAVQFYGYSYKELCSKRIQDINQLSPDEVAHKMDYSKNKTQNYHVFPHKLSNEEVRIVEVYSSPLTIEQRPLLFSIIHDITERKLIESRLQEVLLNLQEKEANLTEAQRLARIGSFTFNLESKESNWSEELFNIYGRDPKRGVPTQLEELSYIHPDDRGKVESGIRTSSEKAEEIHELEFRIVREDGKIIYVHFVGKPYFNSDGKVIKRVGTVMDITERKLRELELRKTLENLERSNKDLEAFAYSASHDLNEPIRMIKSYAQLINLKEKNGLNNSTLEYLKFIEEGAARMQALINDLLVYSRLSTTHHEFEEVDCNIIIKEVLNDLKFKIDEEKANVKVTDLPKVKGNRTQLRQLFQNFIHNALKFRGENEPEINISCERRNSEWLFSIKDNGIGIDAAYYDRIFIIFQRLHDREKYPGTGIGLAMCKKIVERHGGQVCVESTYGKGSIFYFSLPE